MRIEPDDNWEQNCARRLREAGWELHPPGTSCIGSNHTYAGKQDTSKKAALSVEPRAATQRAVVLQALRTSGPCTDVDLQEMLGLVPNSERPRRKELCDGGFVRDSGEKKLHHGEEHILWEAVR